MHKTPRLTSLLVTVLSLFGTSACAADGKQPDLQALPLKLAPPSEARTFAQVRSFGKLTTLLVVGIEGDAVRGIDLSSPRQHYAADLFDVISDFTDDELEAASEERGRVRQYRLGELLHVGPRGQRHPAAGTNYAEHARETGLEGVFLFPKLSAASPPRTEVATGPGVLLDYEVELCARFDREIRRLEDFDQARKGLFLCGDFTDRATLFKKIRLDDVTSGDGFADAKQGADRFPAGQFLVIPKDWKRFMDRIELRTLVNHATRQSTTAGRMLKDLRTLVGESLDVSNARTWSYREHRIPLLRNGVIGTESAVLTGTSEGVVFQEPAGTVMQALMQAKSRQAQLDVIDAYATAEERRKVYLQPGDTVRYESNYLGRIEATVVAPSR
ncbi:MAG: fumarylacetoacetate hydrolase family protein [Pseudoxanthomonas sp.]